MRRIELRYCRIGPTKEGCATFFHDGSSIGAHPHPEMPHYSVIAHRLGYGDDLVRYCREHEFCHSFMEEKLHDRPSRVLHTLAQGGMLKGTDAAYEEIAAQTFQAFLRANQRPIVGGIDWDGLKREALEALDG